jgi:hypothetical protein
MAAKSIRKGIKIISLCPDCKGEGKVPRELPLGANPKAPTTREGSQGYKKCPRCGGIGSIGIK